MADPSLPLVVTQMHTLLTYLLKRIAGFPRTYRFVLGERIGHLAIDILEYLLEATYTRHKKPALDRANLGLEKLRHLLRSSCELECLSLRQYEHAARQINEIGRMVGGWRKQQGDKT